MSDPSNVPQPPVFPPQPPAVAASAASPQPQATAPEPVKPDEVGIPDSFNDGVDDSEAPRSAWRRWGRAFWNVITFPFRFLYRSLKVLAALLILVLLAFGCAGYWVLHDANATLQDITALTNPAQAKLPQPIRVYDVHGQLIGSSGAQQRIVVNGKAIAPVMKKAIVAIEDQRFYQHDGVDFQGVLRALWVNFRAHRVVQGASTLTMQYIRNVYLNFQRTNSRKIKEMALALQLESMWTKQRILDAYLNTVYFANGRYGVEAASRYYFERSARHLNTGQAAVLAGMVQDPNVYDPYKHPGATKRRRNQVLDEMFAQGILTQAQVIRWKQQPLALHNHHRPDPVRDRQLFDLTVMELKQTLSPVDLARGGLNVRTSFDLEQNRRAQYTLRNVYAGKDHPPVIAASFLDPRNGRVRIAASSVAGGFFNYATQSRRQPGSTVKAFTTAAYLQKGGLLTDPVNDSPVRVKDGRHDYTIEPTADAGQVKDVTDALRFSQNPVFWRLYQKAGPRNVLALERRLGLTDMDANAAAALGGTKRGVSTLQLAAAYGALGNQGSQYPAHAIVNVTDFLGNQVWNDRELKPKQPVAAEYARRTTQALVQVVNDGFPELHQNITLAAHRQVAGKTGTTEENADAWFVGMTPQLAGAVWTGYAHSRKPLQDVAGQAVYGATVPAKTWNTLEARLLQGQPVLKFAKPKAVQLVPRVVGMPLERAQTLLAQYRFTNVLVQEKFEAGPPNHTVLSVTPRGNSWVKRSTPITVTYSVNMQPMPDLIGHTYLWLVRQQHSFFRIRVKLQASSETTGTIIAQSIPAGQQVSKGTPVIVTVATERAPGREVKVPYVPSTSELGKLKKDLENERQMENIPDVTGMNENVAEQVLSSLGFRVKAKGNGIVQSLTPDVGTRVPSGTTIHLVAPGAPSVP